MCTYAARCCPSRAAVMCAGMPPPAAALCAAAGDNSLITANCLHPGVVKTELGRCASLGSMPRGTAMRLAP